MQTEPRMSANPQPKPTDLGYEYTGRQLPSTFTFAIYYYAARKLIVILPSYVGWKAEST